MAYSSLDGDAVASPDEHEEHRLVVRTLGGDEFCLEGLSPHITIREVKLQICEHIQAPVFAVKILVDHITLDTDGATLLDVGLAVPDAVVTLLRVQTCAKNWKALFSDLQNAIDRRNTERARHLIDMGAGFDGDGNILETGPGTRMVRGEHVDCPGSTMLHLSMRGGLTDLCLYLLHLTVDPNQKNDCGRPPLIQAVVASRKDQVKIMEALLEARADLQVTDSDGYNALTRGLARGKKGDKVAALLISRCSHEEINSAFMQAPMMIYKPSFNVDFVGIHDPVLYCCVENMPRSLEELLRTGIPICACGCGRTLYYAHCSITGQDRRGRSALHYAYSHGNQAIIDALMLHGADENIEDEFGWTPKDGAGGAEPAPNPTIAARRCDVLSLIGW